MRKSAERRFVIAFLTPAVLLYAVFLIWPLIQAFQFSMYRWRGVSSRRTFVGLGNFVKLAADDAFHKALTNNLELLVIGGLAIMVVSVAVAHGLQSQSRISRTLRGLVLIPQILSLVIVAILWMFLFNPQFGLLTSGMKALGLERYVHTWLGDPHTALPSVGTAFAWYAVGFYIMLFAAGLRSIPAEVIEASELDGAVGLRRFWRVTWPMLWSIKRIAVVHLTITVMNVFVLVFLMTNGGPDRATEVMLTYLYQNAFTNYEFGYATAVAVANFVVVMILSVLILFLFRRNPEVSKA
jgi:N-acetylglucosamine transport system permease protein